MDLGYAPGAWDMFHVGHLAFLRRARRMCDSLVVGVVADEVLFEAKGKLPMFPLDERIAVVEALDLADRVVVDPARDKRIVWQKVHFDRLFKGDDWVGTPQGKRLEAAMAEVGVNVYYLPYTERTSSTKLRAQVSSELSAVPTPRFKILMVCQDNGFHSPVMQAVLQHYIDLNALHWQVSSAGLHNEVGRPLPDRTKAALFGQGLELPHFSTRSLDEALVDQSDLILTATEAERSRIIDAHPRAMARTFTLKQFSELVCATDSRLNQSVDGLLRRAELGRSLTGRLQQVSELSLPSLDDELSAEPVVAQISTAIRQIIGTEQKS